MGRRGIGSRGSSGPSHGPGPARSQYAASSGPYGPSGSSGSSDSFGSSGSRAAPKKPGHGATYSVVAMTLAALAGVGVLAAQAAATAPKVSSAAKNGAGAATQPTKSTTGSAAGGSSSAHPDPTALPANSGTGLRIVYGLAAKRVWLVAASNTVERTYIIVPGTVPAPVGTFGVTNRLSTSAGTDGTPVQYVVLFDNARVGGHSTAFGFDAVANVTGLPPASSGRTGGIRETQADAQALWSFSNYGTPVVVMP